MTNQIKTITLSTGTWVLVKVLAAQELFLKGNALTVLIHYGGYDNSSGGDPVDPEDYTIDLPAGRTYTLIGKADSLSEEQKEEIVEYSQLADADDDHDGGYMDYEKRHWGKTNAKESFLSLLKSQGMDIETTVILKQQS